MSANSKIEWTDSTWNPIRARDRKTGKIGWHCEHATTGCEFCYAEVFNKRLGTGLPFKPGHRKDIEIFLDEKMLFAPLRWKRPRKIFVCSMTDLFASFVPDEWIDKVFAVMALCPQHTFQCLTKRAKRMRDWFVTTSQDDKSCDRLTDIIAWAYAIGGIELQTGEMIASDADILSIQERWPLPNVWLGVSAERQQEWDERKEHLRNTPAVIRFASFEPLLGPIKEELPLSDFIDQAIVGGESGKDARPMHPAWARDLRDQCVAAGVPFFFKQWGIWHPIEGSPRMVREGDYFLCSDGRGGALGADLGSPFEGEALPLRRVGKKSAGRLLDGREWNEFPHVEESIP